MNILMLSSEFPPVIGGIASHVHELSAALVKLGHNVSVVTRGSKTGVEKESIDGISVYRPRLAGSRLIYQWQLKRIVKNMVSDTRPDLIHVHGIRPLLSSKDQGVPVCFTNHSSGFLKRLEGSTTTRDAIRNRIEHCAAVIAPSKELVQATAAVGYEGPLHHILNAVDNSKFCPGHSDIRKRLRIPDDAVGVILSRRLVEKNGVLYFARAISTMARDDCYFIVAGDGEQRQQFEAILRDKPVWPYVRMLGRIPNTEMVSVYRAGQLLVLPSLMEATSISGLEGMACGLAVLGTNVGGIPEIINDGETGLLVPSADSDSLRIALEQMVSNKNGLIAMGKKGVKRIKDEFTWQVIGNKTVHVYSQLLNSHEQVNKA